MSKRKPTPEEKAKVAEFADTADTIFTLCAFGCLGALIYVAFEGPFGPDKLHVWHWAVLGLLFWIASCQMPEYYRDEDE
jgi:hypothetical protein